MFKVCVCGALLLALVLAAPAVAAEPPRFCGLIANNPDVEGLTGRARGAALDARNPTAARAVRAAEADLQRAAARSPKRVRAAFSDAAASLRVVGARQRLS